MLDPHGNPSVISNACLELRATVWVIGLRARKEQGCRLVLGASLWKSALSTSSSVSSATTLTPCGGAGHHVFINILYCRMIGICFRCQLLEVSEMLPPSVCTFSLNSAA